MVSHVTAGASSSTTYPMGNRVIRIRALHGGVWDLPGYSATDVLKWIADLNATTLNEFTSITGDSSATSTVPVAAGQPPMNILQFEQSALDEMGSNGVILPRLPLSEYLGPTGSPTLFFNEAQDIFNLGSRLQPKQSLLLLDETVSFLSSGHTTQDLVNIKNNLTRIGFTGISWGACAATGLPSGVASIARVCIGPGGTATPCGAGFPPWTPSCPPIPELLTSQPSIGEVEPHIDYTSPFMGAFVALTTDQQANILKNIAANQSNTAVYGHLGYHFMYPIIQFSGGASVSYNSLTIFTSSAYTPCPNCSMYTVMKNLMAKYNPVGSITYTDNSPPLLVVPSNQTVMIGTRLVFQVTATDPGETITLAVSNLPSGASFNATSGTFSWTPTAGQQGSYNLTFTAVDNSSPALSYARSDTVRVESASTPPNQPQSPGSCSLCNIVSSAVTTAWLLIIGILIGILSSIGIMYRKTRRRLANARQARLLSMTSRLHQNEV